MRLRVAAATAAAVAFFLTWLAARRFLPSNDEGIFLDGAVRILRGEVPYRDFFILMGPGTFWLQAVALKAFGVSLAASRIVPVAGLSLTAGCIAWILARWTHPLYAAWVAIVTIFLEISDPAATLVNHRADSAALAILAATALLARKPLASGVCAGFAAWVTPSVALVAIALLGWLLLRERSQVARFLFGVAGVSAICAAVLAEQGALAPMIQHMLWTGRNYGAANSMFYGSRLGGYATFFEGASPTDLLPRLLVVLALTMPAILPLAALALSRRRAARENREVTLLLVAGWALLLAAYPRFDVPHLACALPLFCAIVGFHAFHFKRARAAAFAAVCLMAILPVGYQVYLRARMIRIETRVGEVVATPEDAALIDAVEQQVGRGDSVFCFPYLPIFYFLTLGENPTRFSYLQPGMMSDADEALALGELQARPPGKILYQDVGPEMILRIWPASDPARLRMRRIETFVSGNYRLKSKLRYQNAEVEILEPSAVSGQ